MTTMKTRRRAATRLTTFLLISALLLSGCGWRGLNSLPLPGTSGDAPGAYSIQAQLPDVNNIQPNSRVRVGDVTIGNVTKIERQGWHALVTMVINGDVALPQNVTTTSAKPVSWVPCTSNSRRRHSCRQRAGSKAVMSYRWNPAAHTRQRSRPSPRCRCSSTAAAWVRSKTSRRRWQPPSRTARTIYGVSSPEVAGFDSTAQRVGVSRSGRSCPRHDGRIAVVRSCHGRTAAWRGWQSCYGCIQRLVCVLGQ